MLMAAPANVIFTASDRVQTPIMDTHWLRCTPSHTGSWHDRSGVGSRYFREISRRHRRDKLQRQAAQGRNSHPQRLAVRITPVASP